MFDDDTEAVARRILWLTVLATLFAFSVHLFFGSTLAAFDEDILREVVIRNTYENGAHDIYGMALVPSECHTLSTQIRQADEQLAVLVLETWEQPYRDCKTGHVPRSFSIVSFLPENISFKATFDGKWVDVRVIK